MTKDLLNQTRGNSPDVSVVIASVNPAASLPSVLSCFERQTIALDRFEILLIVPSEASQSAGSIKQRHPDLSIRTIICSEPYSISKARALGISESKGEIISLLTDYTQAAPDFTTLHLGAHKSMASPGILIDPPAISLQPLRIFSAALAAARLLPTEQTWDDITEDSLLRSIAPMNLTVPRSVLDSLDLDLFCPETETAWASDREIFLKLKLAGFPAYLTDVPTAGYTRRYGLDNFGDFQCAITRDLARLSQREELNRELSRLCLIVSSFSPAVVEIWESDLERDLLTVQTLENEITEIEDGSPRFDSIRWQRHSNTLIGRVAECLLLYQDYIRKKEALRIYRESVEQLNEPLAKDIVVERLPSETSAPTSPNPEDKDRTQKKPANPKAVH